MKVKNDVPNRRTIEALLRELDREYCGYYGNDIDLSILEAQKEAMKDKLLYKNKKYIALKKKIDALSFKLNGKRLRNTEMVREVRHLYQRKGITPQVIKAMDALVLDLKKR